MPALTVVLFFLIGFSQLILGFLGLQEWLGTFWATAIMAVVFFTRIGLPITVGTYISVVNVFGFDWWVGALVAAPGLLLLVPFFWEYTQKWLINIKGAKFSINQSSSDSRSHKFARFASKKTQRQLWNFWFFLGLCLIAVIVFFAINDKPPQQTRVQTVYFDTIDSEWVLGFDGRNSTFRVTVRNSSRFTLDAPEIRAKMESCSSNRFLYRSAQQVLNRLGFDAGPVDGKIGNRTRAAIARFQTSSGISVSRQLDEATIRELGISRNEDKFPSIGRGFIVGGFEISPGEVAYVDFLNFYGYTQGRDFCYRVSRDVRIRQN